jgi:formate C-acetyltransferase
MENNNKTYTDNKNDEAMTDFKNGVWTKKIDVRDFVFNNMTSYDGDYSFLVGPSSKTIDLWNECKSLLKKEFNNGGVLDVDTKTVSTITSHNPGYINKDKEVIYGLQTDAPLKRAIKPYGGIRVVEHACEQIGKKVDEEVVEIFTKYRKTHNDGVFDAYTPKMRLLRKTGILTGLPDNYARGRIIGDYRRLALYGADRLIQEKQTEQENLSLKPAIDDIIRLREEISEQIKALEMIKEMAKLYGFDVSKPATNAREAIQWTYFAYLAALKEQDGAAMSLGNVSGFFDIYMEQDIAKGNLTEDQAQELIDQFVIKLRFIRHLRMDEYNKLFAGDPAWITEVLGGCWENGKHKVTKTTYRFMQTLYNLGASPEPNMTILWSKELPQNFKDFCAKVSIDTSSIQYENDDLMRTISNCDDYGIACCVSLLKMGKHMQFFGARCNLAKALLMSLNQGRDEKTGLFVVDNIPKIEKDDVLDYEEVLTKFKSAISSLVTDYVDTMNTIHYMHDKYYYERAQMAFLDSEIERYMAFGIAGHSVVADSLSAIKYAKVKPKRDENGTTIDFEIEGEFPKYGNDDDRVDNIAKEILTFFDSELKKHHIYRDAKPTISILTITSNVVYGLKTGATPDGRKAGEPFAPGANPMHGRENCGALASLNSVAKMPYEYALDGISNTFSIIPSTLGSNNDEQIENLVSILDGYFGKAAHHLNVNVLNRETLMDAIEHPENHSQLTIRVSGYAVNFIKLTREQQEEVLKRTFFAQI